MALVNFSLGDIGELVKDFREAITGEEIKDPTKLKELELKAKQLEQAINLGQIEINKNEANNSNWFVAGWRPFIGWICGIAIGYHFVLYPFLVGIFSIFNITYKLPTLDIGLLFNLLLAMLGMAGLRTYEKKLDIQNKH